MKKIISIALILAFAGAITCNAQRSTTNGASFIKKFYLNLVLTDYSDSQEAYYSKHLTARMNKLLQDEYGYECDGVCYAWWMFRIGGNDADIDSQRRSIKVTPASGGWYNVRLTDNGVTKTVKVKLIAKNRTFYLDRVNNPEWQ